MAEGRNPDTTITHYTNQHYHFPDRIPVVLLIDGGSASAAEILSQCLKDYDRVTLIGERTFGKGIVQTSFEMPRGGMLKLTIVWTSPTREISCPRRRHGSNLNFAPAS